MTLGWLCACVAGAVLAAGCASSIKTGALSGTIEGWYAVSSSQTPFYRYGPQQGNGPDMQLPHDAIMKVIRPSFGYCKVQLMPSAKEGYVACEDIKPAPPTLLAALNASHQMGGSSERESFDVRSTDPHFIPPPEALPDPDLPPTTVEPQPQ
jgi:hypothetical protein